MAKPLKIVLFLFGALLLLLVGAVVALPLLINANDYREPIAEAVEENTGRRLSLGDLELKVFPWVRLRVSEAELSNAEGFGDAPFAKVQTVDVGVQVLPLLLNRQLRVSTLTLEGLQVALAIDAEGRSNWEDLAAASEDPDAADGEAETGSSASAEASFKLEDIDIAGIVIRDAALRYDDAQAGQSLRVDALNLSTGRLVPGQPFDFDAAVKLGLGEPAVNLTLVSSARVSPDETFDRIALQGLKLQVTAGGETLADGQPLNAKLALTGDLVARLAAQAFEMKNLAVTVETGGTDTPNGLGLKGRLSLLGNPVADAQKRTLSWQDLTVDYDLANEEITAKGRLSTALDLAWDTLKAELDNLQLSADLGGPAFPRGGKVSAQSALSYDGSAGTAGLRNLVVEALGVTLKGQLAATGLNAEPSARGRIDIAPFAPKALLEQLGVDLPPMRDPKALTIASLAAEVEGSPTRVALRDIVLAFDDSTARGTLELRDVATQALRFDLAVNQLDVDRYLPPEDPNAPTPKPGEGGGGINDIALPTEVLDALNADGTLRIDQLKVSGITLSDARVTLSGPAGQPKRQQISARLYGGSINLDHRYTPGKTPGYALKTSLDSFNAAPFLKDFLGEDYVSGLAKLSLDLSSSGGTVGDLRQALNGQLSAEVRNGAVKGFNLAQVLRRGEALLAGNLDGARTEATTTEATDFATLSVSANIVNGLLKTDNLSAASPLFRLAGGGELDLAKETINFLAKPTVVETATGQDGKALENLRGLTIPIQLSGNLFAPKVRLDIQEALKNKALDGVRQRLDGEKAELDQKRKEEEDRLKRQAEEKITEKLGEGAVDQLRGLFGRPPRATPAPSPQPSPAPAPAPTAEPSPAPTPATGAAPEA